MLSLACIFQAVAADSSMFPKFLKLKRPLNMVIIFVVCSVSSFFRKATEASPDLSSRASTGSTMSSAVHEVRRAVCAGHRLPAERVNFHVFLGLEFLITMKISNPGDSK